MTPKCPQCQLHSASSEIQLLTKVICFGKFYRKSDQTLIQRYRCMNCRHTFSEATFSNCYSQKKRTMNAIIFQMLVSGVSQRRSALILKLNRKTIVRKFILMGMAALQILPLLNQKEKKVQFMEFDDLETFEHSKCKPLSVILAVQSETRRILGFRVAQMPAKGKLVHLARKKYGPRKDERSKAREDLFNEIKDLIHPFADIKSDQNPHYNSSVKKHFPKATHHSFKGRRGCVVGQGELKRGGFDPIFSLNHTCAMLRANLNRLFRRTWCTTKLKERLNYHIGIYALYHNLVLLQNPAK
jgi:transposase-like protein